MATTPVQLDFSKAMPIQQATQSGAAPPVQPNATAPVTLDFSKAVPIQQTPPDAQQQPQQAQPTMLQSAGQGSIEGGKDLLHMGGQALLSAADPFTVPENVYHAVVGRTIPAFRAYEAARSGGASIIDSMKAANDAAVQADGATQAIKKGISDFEKNPTKESVRALTDAVGVLGTAYATHSIAGAEGVSAEAGEAAEATPTAVKSPSVWRQVLDGKDVAQPLAQDAVRSGASSAAKSAGIPAPADDAPILNGNSTILDDHLDALKQSSKAAYKQIDDTVGFDLKAEKTQLANDQYKLGQLGNTDTDITQRGNLIEAINDSESRIAGAEDSLKKAGIDPKAADTLHQQMKAGADFKKALVSSSAPDGSSINIDTLLNRSKALRFSKYGDRLSQFMGGDDNADAFMNQLQSAQEQGVHALKTQAIVKIIAKYGVPGAAGVLGLGEIYNHTR